MKLEDTFKEILEEFDACECNSLVHFEGTIKELTKAVCVRDAEVVGEDDLRYKSDDIFGSTPERRIYRNELRAEIRKRMRDTL